MNSAINSINHHLTEVDRRLRKVRYALLIGDDELSTGEFLATLEIAKMYRHEVARRHARNHRMVNAVASLVETLEVVEETLNRNRDLINHHNAPFLITQGVETSYIDYGPIYKLSRAVILDARPAEYSFRRQQNPLALDYQIKLIATDEEKWVAPDGLSFVYPLSTGGRVTVGRDESLFQYWRVRVYDQDDKPIWTTGSMDRHAAFEVARLRGAPVPRRILA